MGQTKSNDKQLAQDSRKRRSNVIAKFPPVSKIVSYAQNYEDVLLWRIFGGLSARAYLDIGAQDPVVDSVSKLFYEAGWRGIHVEANPFFAERLRAARPDETVIQAAVSDSPGPISFFATDENGLSTGCQNVVDEHLKAGFQFRRITVPVISLKQALEISGADIAWLKVDVEGMEAEVLRSWSDSTVRPPVVLVEATFPNTQTPSHREWEPLLHSRDYRMVHFDGLSRWYLHRDHADLQHHFEASVNIFDCFSVAPFHFSASTLNEERARKEQDLAAEIARIAASAAEHDQLRQRVEAELQQQREQLRDLREREAALRAERDQLAFEKDKVEALQLEPLRIELEKKDAEHSVTLEQVSSKLQLESDQLRTQLHSAHIETALLQQRRGELEADAQRLYEQERQLTAVISEIQARCSTLEAKVTAAAHSEAQARLLAATSEIERENLARTLEREQGVAQQQKVNLAKALEEGSELRALASTVQAERSALDQRVKELSGEREALKAELSDVLRRESDVRLLAGTAEAERKALADLVQDLQVQRDTLRANLGKESREAAEAQREAAALLGASNQLEKQLEKMRIERQATLAALADSTQREMVLSSAVLGWQLEHQRLRAKLHDARMTLEQQRSELEDLRRSAREAIEAEAITRDETVRLNVKLAEQAEKLSRTAIGLAQAEAAVRDYQRQLTAVSTEGEQQSQREAHLLGERESLLLERDAAQKQATLARQSSERMALSHAEARAELERTEVAFAIETETTRRHQQEIARLQKLLAIAQRPRSWGARLQGWLGGATGLSSKATDPHDNPRPQSRLAASSCDDRARPLKEQGPSSTMNAADRGCARYAIFTIVSNNYLHFARTLLASARLFHPDADLFCVIVDKDLSFSGDLAGEFSVIRLADLDLPFGDQFLIQYNVLELNTAVKPWAFEHLMRSYDQVIYIDPDIRLYKRMGEVMDLLSNSHNIVLTPHLLAPISDDKHPTELDIRRAGTYNFGFCALTSTQVSLDFVHWWQKKLERECIVDLDRGIFVDQSWIDLVPGLFDKVAILRHPGYNVAYWNLAQRTVEKVGRGRFTVNGEPLVFFHYSGLNPLNPKNFSKHQNRFTLSNLGPVRELVEDYVDALLRNGARTYSALSYGFGRFDDGETIPLFFADLYRAEPELRNSLGDKPFARGEVLFEPARTVEGQTVSWAMLALWRQRPDLQQAFSLKTADSVRAYKSWFAHDRNYFSDRVAERHLAELQQQSLGSEDAATASTADSQANFSVSVQQQTSIHTSSENLHPPANQLMINDIFYKNLGRYPEPSALATYSTIAAKPLGRFRVWRAVAMSAENRRRGGALGRAFSAFFSGGRNLPRATRAATPVPDSTQVVAAVERSSVETNPEAASGNWHGDRRADPPAPPLFFGGIHFQDGGDADQGIWAGPQVRLPLPTVDAGSTIRIAGFCLPDLLQQQNGSATNEIAAYVAEQCVAVGETDAQGRFLLEGKIEREHRHSALEILARYHFVPKDLGLNEDDRELAMRLRLVEVGERALFDSGAEQPQRALDFKAFDPPGINLVGYVRAESGVGEAARGLAAAARAAKVDYHIVDVGFQNPNRQTDDSAVSGATEAQQDIDLLFVNADQTPSTLRHLQQLGSKATYRVGFWHWEQPVFPKKWLSSFAGLDEIWVPTAFVQEAVSAVASVPVVRIPDAVDFAVPQRPSRKRFGIPARQLAALVMYDFDSYTYRKNPQAAVKAFRLAAKRQKGMVLVIKTINADKHPEALAELKEAAKSLNVIYVGEFLSRSEVYQLQACCDVLISLHRAEGFGLAPAEMMFLGKPVIATGWSGNMDFMTSMNSYPVDYELLPLAETQGVYEAGPVWAEPDIEHAAWCLEQINRDPKMAQARAARGAKDVRRLLSPGAVGAQVRERLNVIARLAGMEIHLKRGGFPRSPSFSAGTDHKSTDLAC